MLYLIGLGLDRNGISRQGVDILRKCHRIYIETYTVNLPYKISQLNLPIRKNIKVLKREDVESNKLIEESKSKKVALLVYGSPLFATTHISLILDAREQGVETKVIYSASIFDAVSATGLQPYKFGKTASMAKWLPEKNYKPDSFIQIIKDNQKIKAHTLLLIDIGFNSKEALNQLEEICKSNKIKLEKIVICSRLGTENSQIYYNSISELKEKANEIELPFCIVIPSDELHFLEKEILENFKD